MHIASPSPSSDPVAKMQSLRIAFGLRLRARRVRQGLSQAELCRRVKISQKGYNCLEMGRNWPSIPVYQRICAELGLKCPPLLS